MPRPQVFGAPIRRVEDPRLVRGSARYVDDLQPPGLLHAAFLRSHLAHARIVRIDLKAARRAPGVVAVWSAADFRGLKPIGVWEVDGKMRIPKRRPLAHERVRHVGQAVAMVVAESREKAHDALSAIDLQLEGLTAITDVEAALREDAPILYPGFGTNLAYRIELKGGDVDRAFRDADVIVKQRLRNQRLIPTALETRGAVAYIDGTRLTIELSNQAPHLARQQLAEALGMDEKQIRVLVH